MAANYVLLEKITVGAAGANSVTFSNIPQTGYTDLVLKVSARSSAGDISPLVTFNSTGGSCRFVFGNGATASTSNSATEMYVVIGVNQSTTTANTFSNGEMYIPNYTSANYKSSSTDGVVETNATTSYVALNSNLWSNTSAITSITLTCGSNSFVQYSTFYLYGVAKLGTTPAIVPYATGGDTIMTDGTYWYHTFVSSGTFTPQKSLSCDYLVVAGGGGGGKYGGGGGAGGLRSTVTATGGGGSLESALSLASGTGYTVTIGAGGAGATAANSSGQAGNNSVFATITSSGGGFGRGSNGGAGGSGGSGGGGAFASGTGGAGTTGQGYAGGNSANSAPNYGTGGGGGAGAVGVNGTTTAGGNGGNGVVVAISGTSVTYAGGGGGGTYDGGTSGSGGTGGGGSANTNSAGTAGTANLGAGGGGGTRTFGTEYNAGNGGSGIVIVRYAV